MNLLRIATDAGAAYSVHVCHLQRQTRAPDARVERRLPSGAAKRTAQASAGKCSRHSGLNRPGTPTAPSREGIAYAFQGLQRVAIDPVAWSTTTSRQCQLVQLFAPKDVGRPLISVVGSAGGRRTRRSAAGPHRPGRNGASTVRQAPRRIRLTLGASEHRPAVGEQAAMRWRVRRSSSRRSRSVHGQPTRTLERQPMTSPAGRACGHDRVRCRRPCRASGEVCQP